MCKRYNLTQVRYKRAGKIIEYFRVEVNRKVSYYTEYQEIGDGYAKVMKNGKWGIITPDGNIWGKMEFSKIGNRFCENFVKVYKNNKVGFADKETGRFIECIYESAEDFALSTAKVQYKGRVRTINALGQFVD